MMAVVGRQKPDGTYLDLTVGHQEYLMAMRTILDKINQIRRPEDPDPKVIANKLITETSAFFAQLLPGIDLREIAAFFGAVLGLEIGGWVSKGKMEERPATDEIVSIVWASCWETVPRVQAQLDAARKQGIKV